MGDITRDMMNRFRRARIRARRYTAGFLATATLVGCGVGWGLRQTGISATADTFCGAEEHTHTQQCYEKVLVCGMEEGETLPTQAPHVHEESCYGLQKICVCGTEAHAHSDACYAMQRNLTCTSGEHSHGDACYTTSGGELTCAAAEHTHSDECKDAEGNLTCDQQQHSHGDGCFSPVERTLSCTLPEHTHDDSCYGDAEKVLICGHGEHEHTDACYEEQQVLVCTLSTEPEAQTPHVHSEACYEERRICGKEEHSHTDQCLSDPTADVEDADAWSANACNPGSGVWAADLLGVASAQLGYAESQRNFRVDENGIRRGYTRYGAWYGDPYGSWNGMFLAYCLHFAGVPESAVSQRAGVSALLADLSGSDRLKNPDDYTPQPGDIAVFGDRVGVIREVGETLTVICGDVDGKVAELSVAPSGVNRYVQVADAAVSRRVSLTTYAASTQETVNYVDVPAFTNITVMVGGITYDLSENPQIEITEGATINFNMDYSLSQRVDGVKYQLPANITVEKIEDKPVLDNRPGHSNDIIGYYDIVDGFVYIRYLDKLWEEGNTTYPGHLEFSGKASKNSSGAYDTITFPGNATLTLTPSDSDTDLSINKSIVFQDNKKYLVDSDGNIEIQYNVTLQSYKGSGNRDLSFSDVLNHPQSGTVIPGEYKEEPKVTKVSYTDGWQETREDISGKVTVGADNTSFEVKDLEPLNANERYEVTYTVLIKKEEIPANFDGTVGNYVQHGGGKQYQDISLSHSDWVTKNGTYITEDGCIEWTIHVDSPSGSLDGFTLKDILPDNLTAGDVVGDITLTKNSQPVTGADGNAVTLSKNQLFVDGYTFQGDMANTPPYDIKFRTRFQGTGETIVVTNKAELTKDEIKYDATADVTIWKDNWSTFKNFLRAEDNTDSEFIKTLYWEIGATNGAGSKGFEYTDTFVNPTEAGETLAHYGTEEAILNALQAHLIVTLTDDTKLTYRQLADKQVSVTPVWTKQGDKVTAFTLKFESTGDSYIKSFHFPYCPSFADVTNVPESGEWTFKNQFNWNEAIYTYRNIREFEKQASFDWNSGYSDDVKSSEKKEVYYQIEVKSSENTFSITDQVEMYLPDGQNLGPICNIYWFAVKYDGGDWKNGGPTNNHVTVKTSYDAENHLFKIDFDVNDFSSDGQEHSLIIRYNVNYQYDSRWNDPDTSMLTFVNTAQMGEKSESATAELYYDLKKIGTQDYVGSATDEESKARTITYTVVINPNGRQFLSEAGGMLTLTDTFSSGNVMGKLVDRSSVQLYRGKKAADCTEANRLSENEYIKTVDMNSSPWLTLAVPDATPLVLQYTCELDWSKIDGGHTSDFGNSVSLQGIVGTNNTVRVYKPSSSSDIGSIQLRVLKIDSKTHAALPDATLKLEKYDPQSKSWSVLNGQFTTDGDGIHAFGIASDAGSEGEETVLVNTLYRVVETIAPKGYYLDDTPRYVIICGRGTTEDQAFQSATGETDSVTDIDGRSIQKNNVIFGTINLSTEVEVPNTVDYRLPNTGGTGTRNYVLFGTLAMILAGCGMIVTRKKYDTGVFEK